MKTKNIFKTLVLAMLLVPACNKSEIANEENIEKKGFALPVTVNVTREGDDATKATYDGSTGKLSFSAGDKLFVNGQHSTAGQFAGTLEYDAVSGKFSGTIYTQNGWTGTADALFTESSVGGGNYAGATLLPDGYGSTGFLFIATNGTEDKYDDRATCDYDQAFALTKAAGVEQLSREEAGYYDNGFVLMPSNAILIFTITGLAASTEVAVVFTESYYSTTINKNVTTDGSGNATFAIGLSYGVDFANCALTVGGLPITLTSSSKTLEAGKIYNISRSMPVVWNSTVISGISITDDGSFESDGITVAVSGEYSSCFNDSEMYIYDVNDYFTFTSSVGNIKKIEINYTGDVEHWYEPSGGWSLGVGTFTWSGTPATSVTLSSSENLLSESGYSAILGITSIVFTLE